MSIIHRETAAELATEALRRLILSQELPAGSRITEVAMADFVGVSRATMRQCLNTLEVEGLVTRNPTTRVLQVTTLSREDVVEVFKARRVLEMAGIEASSGAAQDEIDRVRRAVTDMEHAVSADDVDAFVDADARCHSQTVAFIGSTLLVEMHERLMAKLRLATTRAETEDLEYTKVELARHLEFAALLEAGKTVDAKANLDARLGEAEKLLLDEIARSA